MRDRNPADKRYQIGLVLALNQQAKGLLGFTKSEEVDPVELEAIAVAEQLVASSPNDLTLLEHLARSLIDRGWNLTYKARLTEALVVLDRAIPLQERLIAADTGNDVRLTGMARIRNYRMDCLYPLGRDDEADRDRVAALELFEAIARRSPTLASVRTSAGHMRMNTAVVHGIRGQLAEAVVEIRNAIDWFRPLTIEYPGVPQYRSNLATAELGWAHFLMAAKDWAGTSEHAGRAFATWKELGYTGAAASALVVLADCLVEAGKLDEALRDYTTALEWVNNAIRRSGFQTWTRIDLAAVHAGRAVALHRLSRFSDALADWDKAIDFASVFARRDATQFASYPYNLYTGKAETLTRLNRLTDAEATLRQLLAIIEKSDPDSWTTFHARSLLGAALLLQKRYADAEPLLVKGFEGMKARVGQIPQTARARLAEVLEQLVQLCESMSKKDEAARWRKELEEAKKQ